MSGTFRDCLLWRDPKAALEGGVSARFDLLETLADESHYWRYHLRCRECGQHWLMDFTEEIDWQDGEDPQRTVWLALAGETLPPDARAAEPGAIGGLGPAVVKDWPKGRAAPAFYRRDPE